MNRIVSDESIGVDPPVPLNGIRVLDLTRVLAGPFCTMILADLGADVVKVERPESGDDARHFGPFLPGGLSAYFASINRGKRSVSLDLARPGHAEIFSRLVERADVLVENFRPGTMDRFGFSPQRLKELNPRLISASVSGFGRTGMHGQKAAYDIIIQALSGLMSITGSDPQHPVRVGTSISDILSGLFTAIGILAALRNRETSGKGTDLDLAMLDCTVAALENALSRYEVTNQVPGPLGTRHPSITPFQAFETADRPIVIAAGNDGLWAKLCEVAGCADLARDPRFLTNALRTTNVSALEPLLNERLRLHPAAHWLPRLETAGIPAAPIRTIADVADDPYLQERGMFHTMSADEATTFTTAGSPFRFDGLSPQLSTHAPALGEHTEQVLQDWLGDNLSPPEQPD